MRSPVPSALTQPCCRLTLAFPLPSPSPQAQGRGLVEVGSPPGQSDGWGPGQVTWLILVEGRGVWVVRTGLPASAPPSIGREGSSTTLPL